MKLFKTKGIVFMIYFVLGITTVIAQDTPTITSEIRITENLGSPVRMAIDAQDNIYVTDGYNKSVNTYDSAGNFIQSISNIGSPLSIAIINESEFFVGDAISGHVYKVDQSGNRTVFYSESKFPSSLVIGSDNNLYIADGLLNEVSVISPSGNLIRRIGSEILQFPTGLAFDFKNERIVVAEHGATEDTTEVSIFIFDLEGNLILEFGSEPDSGWFGGVENPENGQFSRIQGVTVSRCGTIYVIDPFQAFISVFDENANFKTWFGEYGSEVGQLNIPLDIVIDSQDKLWVSSLNNGALEIYNYVDNFPTSNIKLGNTVLCTGESIDIPIHLTGVAPWEIVYSIDGVNQPPINALETPYILNASSAGMYEVTALSDNNAIGTCFSGSTEISFNSELPSVTMTCDEPNICFGQEASIVIDFTGTPPWNFEYSVNGQNPNAITTSENPFVLSTDVEGLYEIVSIEGGGCVGTNISGTVQIVSHEVPTATVLAENKYFRVENNELVELEIGFTGEPPFTFSYSINGEDFNAVTTLDNPYAMIASMEGTYEITGVEDANCSNLEWQDFFDVNYNILSLPTSTINDDIITICEGDYTEIPIHFTGSPPWEFTYVINDQYPTDIITSETPYFLTVDDPGVYKIISLFDTVAEGESFTGEVTVETIVLPISNYFYEVSELEVQFINGSVHADSYFWDFGDGNTSIEENPFHVYNEQDNYVVTLTAYNSFCDPVVMAKEIEVGEDVLSNGIDENYKKYTIMVYPNPSYGEFTLKISPMDPIVSDIHVIIQSTAGQLIFEEIYDPNVITLYNESHYINISLINFTKGIYIIYINADNYNENEKLILKD